MANNDTVIFHNGTISNTIENSHVTNMTDDERPSILWSREVTGLVFVALIVIPVLIGNVQTFYVLQKSKLLPYALKLLTSLNLLFDCLYLMVLVFSVLPIITDTEPVLKMIVAELGRIVLGLSWVAMTLIVLERFVCLYWPNEYALYATNNSIRLIIFMCMFVVIIVMLTVKIGLLPHLYSEPLTVENMSKDSPILTYILALCMSVGIVCNIGIMLVVRKQQRRTASSTCSKSKYGVLNFYRSTKTALVIFMVFIAVFLPLLLILMVKHIRNDREGLRLPVFVCSVIMCAINPVLYVWRIKECRYTALAIISKLCNCYHSKTELMRCEVYNIVLNTTTD